MGEFSRTSPRPTWSAESPEDNHYKISVFYLPNREVDAAKSKQKLEQLGFTVNRILADPELQKSVKGHASHIYFKDSDWDVAMRLRSVLTGLMGRRIQRVQKRSE